MLLHTATAYPSRRSDGQYWEQYCMVWYTRV